MANQARQRFYVDPKVQKGMIARLAIYWAATLLFITLPLALFRTLSGSGNSFVFDVLQVWQTHWPILLTLVAALPFVLKDVIRFSNRFAGPVYRLRKEMAHFEKTGEARTIQFRDGDYWMDLASSVNQLQNRIVELESQLEPTQEESKPLSGIVVNHFSTIQSPNQASS